MKRIGFAVLLAALAFGCSKEESKQEPAAAAKPAESGPAKDVAAAQAPEPEAPKAQAAIDERLKPLFEAGKECKWNDSGLAMCKSSSAVRQVAFQNQSDPKLAESCADALTRPDPVTRGLAAECLGGFNDRARIPHMAAGLDAFEKEKDPGVRAAIARAFSSGNARESGVEERVIALVRKLADDPADSTCASYLLDSMFPAYLMQATQPPSKAAGDLALEMATRPGRLGSRALAALGKLSDRVPEVCKVLVEVAQGQNWPPAVESISKIDNGCQGQLDPVVDQIAKELKDGRFNLSQYSATKQFLRRATLSKSQLAKLRKASRARVKKERKSAFAKSAKELAAALKKYKPPKKQK